MSSDLAAAQQAQNEAAALAQQQQEEMDAQGLGLATPIVQMVVRVVCA